MGQYFSAKSNETFEAEFDEGKLARPEEPPTVTPSRNTHMIDTSPHKPPQQINITNQHPTVADAGSDYSAVKSEGRFGG